MAYPDELSPAERVRRALTGASVDFTPFTAYENKVQYGRAERELRNDGMCIVQRVPNCYTASTPTCQVRVSHTRRAGRLVITTTIGTPYGELTSVDVDRGGGTQNPWHEKLLFESAADYKPLRYYLNDLTFASNAQAVRAAISRESHDLFYRAKLGYSPLHDLIYTFMGIERFSYEWADNRRKVLDLYDVLYEKRLALCDVARDAPQLAINICGNVTSSVVSPAMFRDYYLPVYQDTCRILHGAGKLCGAHFDGDTAAFESIISDSDLDYIEALTPPPVGDVTVAQACSWWPDKALWINFPSSLHLESTEVVRSTARALLEEAAGHPRFLMGITEDVPPGDWPRTFRAILDECRRGRGTSPGDVTR